MKKYKWKVDGLFKIKASKVAETLQRIEKTKGKITPKTVVDYARSENSVLHSAFEWDNDKAGEAYRLAQARSLINNIEIVVISDGNVVKLGAYEIINVGEDRTYKRFDSLTYSEIEQVKENTVRALQQLNNKLRAYEKFKAITEKITPIIQELTETTV